jgi:hypothetical protein
MNHHTPTPYKQEMCPSVAFKNGSQLSGRNYFWPRRSQIDSGHAIQIFVLLLIRSCTVIIWLHILIGNDFFSKIPLDSQASRLFGKHTGIKNAEVCRSFPNLFRIISGQKFILGKSLWLQPKHRGKRKRVSRRVGQGILRDTNVSEKFVTAFTRSRYFTIS